MVKALPQRESEEDVDHRANLDRDLDVANWSTGDHPRRRPRRSADIPDAAPDWWVGDEEASQSFLRAAGVV